jgi:hypothetical protein
MILVSKLDIFLRWQQQPVQGFGGEDQWMRVFNYKIQCDM